MLSGANSVSAAQRTASQANQANHASQEFASALDRTRQGHTSGGTGTGGAGAPSGGLVSNTTQAGQTVIDPRSQIDRLNSDGDRVVMTMTAEGKLQLPIPVGGVPLGIGVKGQYGFGITVQQVGDGTNGQQPQYEVTFDKNLLGGAMIEPPVPGIDPAAELNVRTSGSVTMRFDSKEDAARAVQTLQRLAASEAVRDAGNAVSPIGGGGLSNPFSNPVTDTGNGFQLPTPGNLIADQIKPSAQDMNFLKDHVVSYTSRLGLQERGKVAAKFANLGIEPRLDANQTISRTVVLPQNGQPGSLTYTLSGDLQASTKEKLTLGKQQIDQLEIGYVPQNIVDHGQLRGEVSLTWTLPAGTNTASGTSGVSGIPELSGLGAPDKISARLQLDYQTQGLTDLSRADIQRLSIEVTTNNPGQHAGEVVNSLLNGDVRGAFAGMGSDFTVTARNESVRRDGVHQQHEIGLEVADVAEAKVSLEANIGLDDITSRRERTLTGTDIANLGRPVQGPQPVDDPQQTPNTPPQLVVVPHDGLNVRTAPNGDKISAFQNGTFLQRTNTPEQTDAQGNKWVEVTGLDANDRQVTGWVNAAYTAPHTAGAMNGTGRINPDLDAQGYQTHTVKPGDTIWDVARSEGVDFQEMVKLNADHLLDPNMIFPGDTLYIPGTAQPMPEQPPAPAQPQQPSNPSGGNQPSNPSGGNQPSNPSGGNQPSNPSGGNQPSNPSGGNQPSNPSGGNQPSNPSGGNQPSNPSGGNQPSNPSGGNQPSNPSGGNQPSNPSGGNQPSNPSGGNQPVAPQPANGTTTNRADLNQVLRNYQMPTDPGGMVDWKPGAPFGWFTGSVKVTATEAAMLDRLSPFELNDLSDIKDQAFSAADAHYPPMQSQRGNFANERDFNTWARNDGHNDAFRHAYWNALMTKDFGADWTKNFTNAHEGAGDNPADREAMDLYNNEVGRNIATANPNASDEELAALVQQAMDRGELVVIDSNGNLAWSNQVAYGAHGLSNDGAAPGVMPRPDANANTAS